MGPLREDMVPAACLLFIMPCCQGAPLSVKRLGLYRGILSCTVAETDHFYARSGQSMRVDLLDLQITSCTRSNDHQLTRSVDNPGKCQVSSEVRDPFFSTATLAVFCTD